MLLLGVFLYMRLIHPLKLRLRYRIFWGILDVILMIGAGSALPLTIMASRNNAYYNQYNLDVFLPAGYIFITFLCLILAAIVIRDTIWFVYRIVLMIREYRHKTPDTEVISDDQETLSRRQFLKCAASAAAVGGAAALTPAAVYFARSRRIIKNIDIALNSIPSSLDGLRIVHLSDIHVGNTIRQQDIADIVAETNALNPDLIVITGDIADGMPDHIGHWLDPMRELKSKYGTYFVTGNHDHMWDGTGWCKCVAGLNICVLDNEHKILEINGTKLAIAGAIDVNGDFHRRKWRSDPQKALANIPENVFKLMLVHQPASVDISLRSGANLVLAGHTHGGQFWPMTYIIDALHKYSRGLYYIDDKAVFISCGTGYWGPPLRFGVPPEIDVLTLKHKV